MSVGVLFPSDPLTTVAATRALFADASVTEARDEATARAVAQYIDFVAVNDYWLMVFDGNGKKVYDAVVRAKVVELDESGELLYNGASDPATQLFWIKEMLPEDAEGIATSIAQNDAQLAWKEMPSGTFYLPLEWANHTRGYPNVDPTLVRRWDRGEHPDTLNTVRRRTIRALDALYPVVAGLLVALAIWVLVNMVLTWT